MTDRTMTAARVSSAAVLLALAAAAGLAFGVLTLSLQGQLPSAWNLLANSGAVWTVVAALVAAVCGVSLSTSIAAGTLALLGEVLGYYHLAAPWHGVATTTSEQIFWTVAALVIGPFAGLAAHYVRRGSATARVISLLCVCGVPVGEGLYGLARIPEHRLAAQLEVAVGVVVALAALLMSRAPIRGRAAAIPVAAVVAGAVLVFYLDPVLI